MLSDRQNSRFLPGVKLPGTLEITADMGAAVGDAGLIVLAAPTQYMRRMLTQLCAAERLPAAVYVNVAKGIEVETLKRPQEIVAEILGQVRYAALSGPSHAEEVANHLPTAVVCASSDPAAAETVQAAFMTPFFRVYTAADVIGVELGGALKNVFALAAGICDGMGFGDNSKAALITRGIVEMARLGEALGGKAETFSGLSGVGDLIVTCISQHSRNRHVGEELGKGRKLADVQSEMGMVVAEGVKTCISAYELARKHRVAIPVIDQVHAALYEGKDPRQAARDLMTRDAKPENERG
jgi:glycerol-3-phosphate dehydrogenase (NAD(P)+)